MGSKASTAAKSSESTGCTGPSNKYRVKITPLNEDGEEIGEAGGAVEEAAVIDGSRLAARAVEKQTQISKARELSLQDVLKDEALLAGLRAVLRDIHVSEDQVRAGSNEFPPGNRGKRGGALRRCCATYTCRRIR